MGHLCIFNNCRPNLKRITKLLLKGLKVVASGTEYYLSVRNISPDNIYYFDMGATKYLTFTDMRFNAVPLKDNRLAPWPEDMHKVGVLLA